MTNKEAIKWLKSIDVKYIHGGDECFDEQRHEAIKIAIKALRGVSMTTEEVVNHLEYLKIAGRIDAKPEHINIEALDFAIESIREARKAYEAGYAAGSADGYAEGKRQGSWIWGTDEKIGEYCKCSICGIGMGKTPFDYCPNCGAHMAVAVCDSER